MKERRGESQRPKLTEAVTPAKEAAPAAIDNGSIKAVSSALASRSENAHTRGSFASIRNRISAKDDSFGNEGRCFGR